jgi:transposase
LALKTVEPRITLFVAISNKGEVYYSVSQANTCKETKSLFLHELALILDEERPLWRKDTLITMDNATYNTCPYTIEKIKSLGMTVLFQGPYGYDVAAAELFFA